MVPARLADSRPRSDRPPAAASVRGPRRAVRRPATGAAAAIPGRHLSGERLRPGGHRGFPFHDEVGEDADLLAPMVDPPGDEEDRALDPRPDRLLPRPREDDDLDRALDVLHRDDGHRRPRLRHHRPDAGDDRGDDDPLAVERFVVEVARVGGDELPHGPGDLAHRVLGEVQPEQLLLPAETLAHRRLGRHRQRRLEGGRLGRAEVEQRRLAGDAIALDRLGRRHRVVEAEEDPGRRPERRERPDLRQRLDHLAVDEAEVDPGAEVGQRAELAALVAGGDDRLDRALADVLDGEEAEADRVPFDGELEPGAMDVRHPDLDAEAAALGDGRGDLLLVGAEGGQHARHVLDRVVRLEVGGLVGDEPVARRVGLVEAVALERLEGGEDRVDRRRADPSLGGLGHELLPLGAEDRGLLLADGVAEGVRLRAGEAAEGHRGGHDVLLVDEDPVRLLEVRLEQRMEVRHRLLAVLAADVGRDVVHRAGPVEGHHRGEVVDRGRLELPDVAAHAGRLELEHAGRLARGEELERGGVVERDVVEVDDDAPLGPDEVDRLAEDRQVREAEEVELEEAEGLDPVHLVLGHERRPSWSPAGAA